MMKTALKIALAPVMLTIRLILGLAAFLTSIASSVLGFSYGFYAVWRCFRSSFAAGKTASD